MCICFFLIFFSWCERLRGLSGQRVYHATFAASLPLFFRCFQTSSYAHQAAPVRTHCRRLFQKKKKKMSGVSEMFSHCFHRETWSKAWKFLGFGSRSLNKWAELEGSDDWSETAAHATGLKIGDRHRLPKLVHRSQTMPTACRCFPHSFTTK